MLHLALLSSIAAATDPKISTSGPDGAKHITISSGPGVSIQAAGGTYEIGDRFAKLEAEAAALSTMAEETKARQGETRAELKKFKEAINDSCPTGSMVVGHNADGTPICNGVNLSCDIREYIDLETLVVTGVLNPSLFVNFY